MVLQIPYLKRLLGLLVLVLVRDGGSVPEPKRQNTARQVIPAPFLSQRFRFVKVFSDFVTQQVVKPAVPESIQIRFPVSWFSIVANKGN